MAERKRISRVVFGDPSGDHLVLDLDAMTLSGGQHKDIDHVYIDLLAYCRDAGGLLYQIITHACDGGVKPSFVKLFIDAIDVILNPTDTVANPSVKNPKVIPKGKMRDMIEENIRHWDVNRDEYYCPPFVIEYDDGRKVAKIR